MSDNFEYKLFNKMAAGMDSFHEGFRITWTELFEICSGGVLPTTMTPQEYVQKFLDWCEALDKHHKLEEEHVFPKLAVKMPVFRPEFSKPDFAESQVSNREPEIYSQHREIHAGLDSLHEYLKAWKHDGKIEVDLSEVKRQMESFGPILWQHMDEEVDMLRAENMRLYWTADEMRGLPFKVRD